MTPHQHRRAATPPHISEVFFRWAVMSCVLVAALWALFSTPRPSAPASLDLEGAGPASDGSDRVDWLEKVVFFLGD